MDSRSLRLVAVGGALFGATATLALLFFPTSGAQPQRVAPTTSPQTPVASTAPSIDETLASTSATREPQVPYLVDRVMVRPTGAHTAQELADTLGGSVLRDTGRSGFAVLLLPDGIRLTEALDDLTSSGLAQHAQPVGITRGAGALQWHKAQRHHDYLYTDWLHDSSYSGTLGKVTVALLDTGVAYANDTVQGVTYAQAPSLSEVDIVEPYDFINDDSQAYDDHMHGTHIASLIASRGGSGSMVAGLAPNVALMPIKVLDAHNEGTEFELIEGLWHAVDHDADIVNMSLSMAPGYTPSLAMQEALAAAQTQGTFLIAAAGNDALNAVSWPAASPYVTAVSSTCFDGNLAPYSNRGPEIALTAYGGCMHQDDDGDGRPDGLLAETLVEGDPSQTQLAYWGGTSQAAAVATGVAAALLAEDVEPSELKAALQMSTAWRYSDFEGGMGAGLLWADVAADVLSYNDYWNASEVRVAVLPFLIDEGGSEVRPAARITVVRADDTPYPSARAYIRMRGTTDEVHSCRISHGECTFYADDTTMLTGADEESWTIEVAAIVDYDVPLFMESTVFATDGLELALAALEQDDEHADLPVGVHWQGGTPTGRDTMAESYTWPDSGTGFASSPMATLFSPGWTSATWQATAVDLDTNGVGFSSSPMLGFFTKLNVPFNKHPLGGPPGQVKLLAMDGVGFSSSPMGLDAWDIWSAGGSTVSHGGANFNGQALGLSTGGFSGNGLNNSALGTFWNNGGWSVGGASQTSTFMTGSGVMDAEPVVVGTAVGDGYETY